MAWLVLGGLALVAAISCAVFGALLLAAILMVAGLLAIVAYLA